MILKILFIHIIIVIVWNILDFPNEIVNQILRVVSRGRIQQVSLQKPFGCCLCMTFWVTLAFQVWFLHKISIQILLVSLLSAVLTNYTTHLIKLINIILSAIYTKTFNILEKWMKN